MEATSTLVTDVTGQSDSICTLLCGIWKLGMTCKSGTVSPLRDVLRVS